MDRSMVKPPNKRFYQTFLITIVGVILLILALIIYATANFYYAPIPKTSGQQRVVGLQHDVTVYRDEWGIPHIYASSVEDLFFAQGYTHAQDRWWQMEFTRKLGRGQLTRILGQHPQIIQTDYFMHMLSWLPASENEWVAASPETRQALLAYSAGVNAYISERSTNELAVEYSLLAFGAGFDDIVKLVGEDTTVDPWEPVDSLLWGKWLAWQMSGNWQTELTNTRLLLTLDPTLLDSYLQPFVPQYISLQANPNGDTPAFTDTYTQIPSLLSPYAVDSPTIQYPHTITLNQWENVLNAPTVGNLSPQWLAILGLENTLRGNSWVVNGNHTTTGKPLLANDLQGDNTIPATWFEMGLHCRVPSRQCPYDVVGFSVPGLPAIIAGHNDRLAWGINSLNADVQDLYLLQLNPRNPTQYRDNGQWVNMTSRVVEVGFDKENEKPLTYTVYDTRWGHVLTDISALISGEGDTVFNENYQALALRWIGTDHATTGTLDMISALLQINQAQNYLEFQTALTHWAIPALQFVYADVDGNIASQVAGYLPRRSVQHNGAWPVPANGSFQWQGLLAFEAFPGVFNPTSGIIISANNPVTAGEQSHLPTHDLVGHYRAKRILDLLVNRQEHSPDSFARMQADTINEFARVVLPYVLALPVEDEHLQTGLVWLGTWDLQNNENSPQAAWFEVLWHDIAQATFADQADLPNDERLMLLLAAILPQAENLWWDDAETPFTIETRDEILQKALLRSYNRMVNDYGSEPETWQWGEMNQIQFVGRIVGHEGILPLSNVADLSINRGGFPLGGCMACLYTTMVINYQPQKATQDEVIVTLTLVPAYRFIIDLADFSNSRSMQSTGQSGHPASENYDDMIMPWRSVEYHNMGWGLGIADNAHRQLDLQPAPLPTENSQLP
jgi:penicillin amidase